MRLAYVDRNIPSGVFFRNDKDGTIWHQAQTGAGAGGLITGAGWRGVRGCEPVVRAGVVSVFAPEVVGVVDVELGVVAVWLVVEVEGLLWPVV